MNPWSKYSYPIYFNLPPVCRACWWARWGGTRACSWPWGWTASEAAQIFSGQVWCFSNLHIYPRFLKYVLFFHVFFLLNCEEKYTFWLIVSNVLCCTAWNTDDTHRSTRIWRCIRRRPGTADTFRWQSSSQTVWTHRFRPGHGKIDIKSTKSEILKSSLPIRIDTSILLFLSLNYIFQCC